MIYAYGITMQGTYHVKNNIVCQDANEIVKCGDDWSLRQLLTVLEVKIIPMSRQISP
jgi:hypothetical protein